MSNDDVPMPDLVRQVNSLPYDYADGDGIDFEPFEAFMSAEETASWFQAWTGNPEADASMFAFFGKDGTGGHVSFWKVRPGADLLGQPVVFLGSEGQTAIVARDFHDYLWLLAAGIGPYEAAAEPDAPRVTQPALAAFAMRHAGPPRSPEAVLAAARQAFPDFVPFIESLCR
jgi:hypothetical protein